MIYMCLFNYSMSFRFPSAHIIEILFIEKS